METLQLLALALGLSAISGIRLYLTVFLTGLAIHFNWLHPHPHFQSLQILAHPAILTVSGSLFLIEFLADKIPWLDTIWDTVHTFLRPIGAILLSLTVLGDTHPLLSIIGALLGGTLAFSFHSAKAASRIAINTSPEPFSNILTSFAEDASSAAALVLLAWNPILFLSILFLLSILLAATLPFLFRLLSSRIYFAWKKLTLQPIPAYKKPPSSLPLDLECAIHQLSKSAASIQLCLPAFAAKVPNIPRNSRGWLVTFLEGNSPKIAWIGKIYHKVKFFELPANLYHKLTFIPGFLFDKLTLPSEPNSKKSKPIEILFDHSIATWS
ncbi:MAG: DUF4126 domain-containing protein, partial [Chthoniobacterales bacterium]|nr:DUF4126 domain-containing protein [Chthoniobacterales bacterium]